MVLGSPNGYFIRLCSELFSLGTGWGHCVMFWGKMLYYHSPLSSPRCLKGYWPTTLGQSENMLKGIFLGGRDLG